MQIVLVIILFLSSFNAVSAEDFFRSIIAKDTYSINEAIQVKIEITKSSIEDLEFATNTVDYQVVGQSQSSSFQIINGKTSQKRTVTLSLRAKHDGIINIPSATANYQGGKIATEMHVIKITPASQAPGVQDQLVNRATQAMPSNFARVELSKASPYLNEQLTLRLKLYHPGNLRSINSPELKLNDFIYKMVPEAQEYEEYIAGRRYFVYELAYILYPIKSGQVSIPAVSIEGIILENNNRTMDPFNPFNPLVNFNPFFAIEKALEFKTKARTITVKALPPAPADFSGYVGDLTVQHKLDRNQINSSEAISLSTTIYGNGNYKNLSSDYILESKQYSIYKDKDQINTSIDKQKAYFEIKSKAAILAQTRANKLIVKTKAVVSFNPLTKKFEEQGEQEFTIDINLQANSNNSDEEQNTIVQVPVESKKELLYLSDEQIVSYIATPYLDWILYLILVLINLYALITLIRPQFKFDDAKQSHNKILRGFSEVSQIAEYLRALQKENHIYHNTEMNLFIYDLEASVYGQGLAKLDLVSIKKKALELIKEAKKYA